MIATNGRRKRSRAQAGRKRCRDVAEASLPGGHFFVDQYPDETTRKLRDFLKRHRFEVSGIGGFYASDTLSSTYSYGGALAYFPSEDFGLEVLVTRSPVRFRLEEPFEGNRLLNPFCRRCRDRRRSCQSEAATQRTDVH